MAGGTPPGSRSEATASLELWCAGKSGRRCSYDLADAVGPFRVSESEPTVNTDSPLFAHGNPAMPFFVASLEQAKQRARQDAVRRGERQAVLLVDLHHPDQSIVVLGYMNPDGGYEEILLA